LLCGGRAPVPAVVVVDTGDSTGELLPLLLLLCASALVPTLPARDVEVRGKTFPVCFKNRLG
jgi:hypothetical protein